jgi:phage anti-repressor protein
MNQIVPKTVNFKELVENSNTTLSLTVQSKLVEHLNREFTEEQQQWYIANLYVYMHYHPTNDYPINLEHVYKLIGFANKGNAMKTIKSNFIENEDYKTSLLPKEKSSWGGSGKDEIMLNVDTFKNLCMIAKTDKGKEIRKYYVKLENIYNQLIKEEIEQQSKLLEQTQQQLKKEQSHKNQILRRKYYDMKPGDVIYLYQDNEESNDSLLKIGKSKNISEREKTYSNMSKKGTMVYVKRCLNCDLTESLLHHLLDKYRVNSMQEWFKLPSIEFGKQIISAVIDLIDSQLESIEVFIPKLENFMNNFDTTITDTPPQDNNDTTESVKVNPKDFDKFIEDCCDVSPDYKQPKGDLKQAHRVWSQCCTKDVIQALDKYLKDKFSGGIIIENDIKRNVYKGVKLKQLNFTPENLSDNDFEQFILEKCNVNWAYRISYTDFFSHFVEWKKNIDTDFTLTYKRKQEIQKYLERIFVGGRVYLSDSKSKTHLFGVWGLGMSFNNFGLKIPQRTNKQVCQFDANTNEVVNTWDSLSVASRALNVPVSTMSNYCRFSNVVSGFYYKYI